jgi:hypothetical protein
MVEMWLHRGGYHWPNEPITAHCRKRYRLTQSKNANALPCDPSLWIIHYSRAEPENVIPANQLPLQPPVLAALNQRRFLQSQGHLARKEFMLHDKANWPTINLPSSQGLQYPPHMIARQQAAAAQMQMGASPIKHVPERNQHRRGPSNVLEPTLEEEEDVSRGDMLDFMTPREISRMRYEQHHEWMEEIMSSPFAMKQIVPTDLGLGRKGELEALTSGFFEPPTSVLQATSANALTTGIGRMEVTKAEEFTTKAARKVAEMEAELENLKKRHTRRMAKLDKSSSLNTAEKRLRVAAGEGGRQSIFEDCEAKGGKRGKTSVDDIVRDVETATGKKIVPVSIVECVQRGGLEEKVKTPRPTTPDEKLLPGNAVNRSQSNVSNPDPSGTFTKEPSPNLQQQRQPSANPPQSSQLPVTSHVHGTQQPVAQGMDMDEPAVPSLDDMDVDVEMAGLGNGNDDEQPGAQTAENDGSEWVMVDDMNADSITKEEGTPAETTPAQNEPTKQPTGTESPGATAAAASGFLITPTGSSGIQGLTPIQHQPVGEEGADDEAGGMNTGDFDLGQGEFDTDLDDAGGGLVDFGDEHGDLGLEGMDDSAFGDAFHPPDDGPGSGHLTEHGDMS